MEFADDHQADDEGNLQQMLDDLAIGQQSKTTQNVRKDTTFFIIDCAQQMMTPLQGQTKSQFDKIMEGYANFMMSKVIANAKDQVGLILYNINAKQNSLNFDKIYVIHKLQQPSAAAIKSAATIRKDYIEKYGIASQDVPLHQVLWLYGNEIKQFDASKNYLRLFLFTIDDCPHPQGDEKRQQAINHARQLCAKGIQIQLFPIRRSKKCTFDIRKFYQNIISIDVQDFNQTSLDNSNKILNLQSRLRQKEFKKRTLNRLLMKIGNQTQVGIKIFCLYNKAKKPIGKKLQASTNKPLKRVIKRMNDAGQILYQQQIGTYFPLGGQKVKLSKADVNKIKSIQRPGITLIGFKPKSFIKPYHNIRTSYFLYPDEQHVSGSCQFFDALIEQLSQTDQVAIVKIMPRQNQQLRFAALFPQKQNYDEQDHQQTAPGFNMIILPYAQDIVNFAGSKTIIQPVKLKNELVQVTKLLINNMTVQNFDLRDFQNPSLQKFYRHIQAHALNEPSVQQAPDMLVPDAQSLSQFKDVIKMIKQAANQQDYEKKQEQDRCNDSEDEHPKNKKTKKQVKKQAKKQVKYEQIQKKSKVKGKKQKNEQIQVKSDQDQKKSLIKQVQAAIYQGDGHTLKVSQLKQYLHEKQLNDKGKKQQLIDRIMVYISKLNQI